MSCLGMFSRVAMPHFRLAKLSCHVVVLPSCRHEKYVMPSCRHAKLLLSEIVEMSCCCHVKLLPCQVDAMSSFCQAWFCHAKF